MDKDFLQALRDRRAPSVYKKKKRAQHARKTAVKITTGRKRK